MPRIELAKKARTALGRKVVQARGEFERHRNDTSLSAVGLRAPLSNCAIRADFRAAGFWPSSWLALLPRPARTAVWDECYVRQNIGAVPGEGGWAMSGQTGFDAHDFGRYNAPLLAS